MPKVLRIINRFNLGGPTYNAAYLTKHLSNNFETLLVGGVKDDGEGSSEYILDQLGIKAEILPEMKRSLNASADLQSYRKITKLIKEFKPDIVHTHASKAGTVGRLAAIRNKVPVIVHTFHGHVFHSYFGKKKTNFFINIEKGLANHTSQIIAISDSQKKELAQDFKIAPAHKISVVPLGFDLDRFQENNDIKRINFRNKYHLKETDIAIGIVGRLAPIKNHELFLKAIKHVKAKTNKNIKAFIIGDGEQKEHLANWCKNNQLSFSDGDNPTDLQASVIFTSWIRQIDLAYPGLDIVAMTSLNEGTPVSLIEAQAANKPIVTTNVGGIENIVLAQKNTLLAENNNLEDYSNKLLQMVEDDAFRASAETMGWEHVRQKFHYNRLASDTEKLYNTLLSNGKNKI